MEQRLSAARPIFLNGLEDRLNVQAGFRRDLTLDRLPHSAVLQLAARSFYRLYVNGTLVMHGPARTAHGRLRVEELDLLPWLRQGENALAVELTASVGCLGGYSNDCTAESSMLLAQLDLDGETVLATDADWDAVRLTQRVEYSDKMSHCRQNSEIYHLDEDYTAWRTARPGDGSLKTLQWEKAAICAAPRPQLLTRPMPYPSLEKQGNAALLAVYGTRIDSTIPCEGPWFAEAMYPDYYKKIAEHPLLDYVRAAEGECHALAHRMADGVCFTDVPAGEDPAALFDLGALRLGFIGFTVTCAQPGVLDIVHLEYLHEKKTDCLDGANPVTRLYLPAGTWSFLTMEPALVRYLEFYFRGCGSCSVTDIHVREYCYPARPHASFRCDDEDINRIFEAACLTLRLNTLDIFMDCPERERGGWLCDSLWTSRGAALLLDDLSVERAFLENFLLAPYGDGIGSANNFFPEVYPGSKKPGAPSITTWSFWLMLELAEYVERSGDLDLALTHEKRVRDFVDGSRRYIGSSGLLQDMPFIFVDWSQSNDFENTQPVSTAANALYAFMLQRLAQLYHEPEWDALGKKMRGILRAALAGENGEKMGSISLLPDSLSVEPDGSLKGKSCFSESCQYTALWAHLFEKDEVPQLARNVVRCMGTAPLAAPNTSVGPAQLFIGLCIRMDLLAQWGEKKALLREMRAIYLPQLRDGPGTLWEVRNPVNSSRCHGFNAHAGVHLLRDFLGIDIPKVFDLDTRRTLTPQEQQISAQRPADLCGLEWMRGAVETAGGLVTREIFAE